MKTTFDYVEKLDELEWDSMDWNDDQYFSAIGKLIEQAKEDLAANDLYLFYVYVDLTTDYKDYVNSLVKENA